MLPPPAAESINPGGLPEEELRWILETSGIGAAAMTAPPGSWVAGKDKVTVEKVYLTTAVGSPAQLGGNTAQVMGLRVPVIIIKQEESCQCHCACRDAPAAPQPPQPGAGGTEQLAEEPGVPPSQKPSDWGNELPLGAPIQPARLRRSPLLRRFNHRCCLLHPRHSSNNSLQSCSNSWPHSLPARRSVSPARLRRRRRPWSSPCWALRSLQRSLRSSSLSRRHARPRPMQRARRCCKSSSPYLNSYNSNRFSSSSSNRIHFSSSNFSSKIRPIGSICCNMCHQFSHCNSNNRLSSCFSSSNSRSWV
ncbi:uncharacterized protein LOC133348597 isoform X2 [Lethenteron reissneri]|uniref:uncharacterized protein LOC133348597 isoform X2 n=1 Tax=Lethenteron reissneri TaxID=7753 RepID=UPI002AB69E91|nr:uncharacterized protein LOC133348597 isoform X2 [Lethenteron reissneri]